MKYHCGEHILQKIKTEIKDKLDRLPPPTKPKTQSFADWVNRRYVLAVAPKTPHQVQAHQISELQLNQNALAANQNELVANQNELAAAAAAAAVNRRLDALEKPPQPPATEEILHKAPASVDPAPQQLQLIGQELLKQELGSQELFLGL